MKRLFIYFFKSGLSKFSLFFFPSIFNIFFLLLLITQGGFLQWNLPKKALKKKKKTAWDGS